MEINKKQNNKPKKEQPNKILRFSGVAFQMGVVIAFGTWGGNKLDMNYPHKYPIFTIICSLSSVGIALYMVIKEVINMSKEDE